MTCSQAWSGGGSDCKDFVMGKEVVDGLIARFVGVRCTFTLLKKVSFIRRVVSAVCSAARRIDHFLLGELLLKRAAGVTACYGRSGGSAPAPVDAEMMRRHTPSTRCAGLAIASTPQTARAQSSNCISQQLDLSTSASG
jgi:hypothetical protein